MYEPKHMRSQENANEHTDLYLSLTRLSIGEGKQSYKNIQCEAENSE